MTDSLPLVNPSFSQAKVVSLCLGAAVGYGIVHDQITARLCIEYFTVAHAPLIQTTSPTLIGLFWGVAATFGVGLALGCPLALVAHSPGLPPVPLAKLGKSIGLLLAMMATAATVCGFAGFELSRRGFVSLPESWADVIPLAHANGFMAAWAAHGASYLVGLVGGCTLIFRIWRARGKPFMLPIFPQNRLALLRAILVVAAAGVILWWRFFRP